MTKKIDKSDWAIGGGVIAGTGAGFFFIPHHIMAFVACILIGLGVGLFATALISAFSRHES